MSLAYSPALDDQLAGQRFKKKPMPRAALQRAVEALREKAHDEAAVSQGGMLVEPSETQAWQDAQRIEKWLKR